MSYIVSQSVMDELGGVSRHLRYAHQFYAGVTMSDEDVAAFRRYVAEQRDALDEWLSAFDADFQLIRGGA